MGGQKETRKTWKKIILGSREGRKEPTNCPPRERGRGGGSFSGKVKKNGRYVRQA